MNSLVSGTEQLFIPFEIQPQHDISPNEIDAIENRLYDHNRCATRLEDGRALAFVVRDEAGRLTAAAAGHSWGGSAELKQLWVAEAYRRRGIGRKLLSAFETEATLRRVRQIWVVTFDVQAPALYEKAGFERMAEFAGWPDGHSNIVFRKALSVGL